MLPIVNSRLLHATMLALDAAPSLRLGLVILELVMEVLTGSVLDGTPVLKLDAADAFGRRTESGPLGWLLCPHRGAKRRQALHPAAGQQLVHHRRHRRHVQRVDVHLRVE
jgi:hypothetical protein